MGATTNRKLDLKRTLGDLYTAKHIPSFVEVPPITYLMIDGSGDPNTSPEYAAAVEALYAVSYTLKFAVKRGPLALDYTVMPLEGLWWADDWAEFTSGRKDQWKWTMIIAQPDVITPELVDQAKDEVGRKKGLANLDRLRLETYTEGRSAQVLHLGPYSAEGPTIAALHEFIHSHGCTFSGEAQKHHEIYLNDPRRTAPEKLKTIIRQPVVTAPPD